MALFKSTISAIEVKLHRILTWGLISLNGLVAGCAYSPGLAIETRKLNGTGSDALNPDQIAVNERDTLSRISSDNDNSSSSRLINITAELIRLQRLQRIQQADEVGRNIKSLFGVAKPYTIGFGDVLNIVVWDHPELILSPAASALTTDMSGLSNVGNGYNVSDDGFIQFPYAGTVKLVGLTEAQARTELISRLDGFVKDPQITLRIQAYRSGRIYVEGEVKQPGVQSVNDIPLTLKEAIGRAGGLSTTADQSAVLLIREGHTISINLPQLTKSNINLSSILLRNGDTVQIPNREDSQVFVLGEVVNPKPLSLHNGQLTLGQALGQAGGISQVSGDPREIYVLRNHINGGSEIYHLNADSPMTYALAGGFQLKPNDVVFVNPTALVRFNRVISLLLPSAQTTSNAIGMSK